MLISYNWLKWYIPEVPEPGKLQDIFSYHLSEVEGVEKKGDDHIFDLNILPNRAHDLLSHMGIARELSSLLHIEFKDPVSMYKVPEAKTTGLEIEVKTDKCRRYMGRIVRNVKIGSSPDWVVKHLESIGQKSINNMVDAGNLVMYDSGQPCHIFDLDKLSGEKLIVRNAKEDEGITTLDGKEIKLSALDMVIADEKNVLAMAGIKGGKIAEVDSNTKNILIEVANFNPVSVRKTSKRAGVLTDSSKRFENDLSPELAPYAMREISGLLVEYGAKDFEEIVDVYSEKPKERKLSFGAEKISKILGVSVSPEEIEDILKRYKFDYARNKDNFEITVPFLRLDLIIAEDMAEEVGRILGYDKVKPKIPKIDFKPRVNEFFSKMSSARSKLLSEGYSEVMTYTFCEKGEVQVLASASDKKFLRTNLSDGLKESLKLNQLNAPLLGIDDVKIFEIGTVFLKDREEMHVAYGSKREIKEMKLYEFDTSGIEIGKIPSLKPTHFKMWSSYPFISRDIAVWMPKGESPEKLQKILKENSTELLLKKPHMFDSFTKGDKTSYAFRLIFQSAEKTLKDEEVNEIMAKIGHKIRENSSWEIR